MTESSCLEPHKAQFGRLVYWQMALHPSSNQYVLVKFLQMFTQESGLRQPFSPDFSGYYTKLSLCPIIPPPSSLSCYEWLSDHRLEKQHSWRVQWDTPSSSRTAKSSNQTRHPSLSCGLEWPWPWCSLHTQFKIPLGSIMGRFKQQEHSRPLQLILHSTLYTWWCV